MISRISHTLLIALFMAAHLWVQPLSAMKTCGDGDAAGSSSCCCSGSVSGSEEAPKGCCGGDQSGEGDPQEGSEINWAKNGCGCSVVPSAPLGPPLVRPSAEPAGVSSEVYGAAACFALAGSPLGRTWPSLEGRAARPPDRPPHVRREVRAVFTQVYRI